MSSAPEPIRDRGTTFSVVPQARSSRIGIPPAPLTPLIGRRHERERVTGLIRDGARLVTLSGTGGVGKTRLVLQLALDLRDDFAGALAWVPLATVREPDAVVPAIAQALGAQPSPGLDLTDAVHAAIRDNRFLLLLDNVEHVLPAASSLTGILRACPRLVVLATSRSLLRVSGEHAVHVPALEIPAPASSYAELLDSEAIQLFTARARAVSPDFTLDEEGARIAADICARLDGLPLAIELAAAQVSVLPLPALWTRLERRLPLLTGGALDQPPRHRAMRDAVAWSYDLLGPREQAVFRKVAIHTGGFRLEAVAEDHPAKHATRVRSDESGTHSGVTSDTLDSIRILTDHSLLYRETDPDGEPRFAMLETIREFALEELEASGELKAAEQARATYLTELIDRHRPSPLAPGSDLFLALLELEQANIRECLTWLARIGDEERAFRLAEAFTHSWIARGHYEQGRAWLERLLSHHDNVPDRAEALVGLGYTLIFQGQSEWARTVLEDALTHCQEQEDPLLAAMALVGLGVSAGQQGRYEAGMDHLNDALALAETLDDPVNAAVVRSASLSPLGTMAHGLGRLDLADDYHTRSLTLRRRLGDIRGASRALADIGNVAVDRNEPDRALEHIRESLSLAARYPNPPYISHALVSAARIALDREQPARAARLLGVADALRGEIEHAVTLEFEHRERERAVASARAMLGDGALAGAMSEGRALSLVDVIAEIDDIAPPPGSADPVIPPATEQYGLTPRELDVLRGIVDYLTDGEIAERLFISKRTVGWHVTGILSKLAVDSRRRAATKALDEHLV